MASSAERGVDRGGQLLADQALGVGLLVAARQQDQGRGHRVRDAQQQRPGPTGGGFPAGDDLVGRQQLAAQRGVLELVALALAAGEAGTLASRSSASSCFSATGAVGWAWQRLTSDWRTWDGEIFHSPLLSFGLDTIGMPTATQVWKTPG